MNKINYQGQTAKEMVNAITISFNRNINNEFGFVGELIKDDRFSSFDAEILYQLLIKKSPQPIETAPKDGTVIDIWHRQERITNARWNKDYKQWQDKLGNCYDFVYYWQPIPQIRGE